MISVLIAGGWIAIVIIIIVVLLGCAVSLFGGGSDPMQAAEGSFNKKYPHEPWERFNIRLRMSKLLVG